LFPIPDHLLVASFELDSKLFPIFVREVAPIVIGLDLLGELSQDRLLGGIPSLIVVPWMLGLGGFPRKGFRGLRRAQDLFQDFFGGIKGAEHNRHENHTPTFGVNFV
jgi:hypothetical protein